MEEIISLARECIGEMLKMSPDEIEAFQSGVAAEVRQ